jgi:hypothetical protein
LNELLKQISSYHLFNYLLPGCLFAVIATKLTQWNFIESNLLLGLFLYYFYGLIISRIGSLVVEPALKWCRFLKFSNYSDYVTAAKKDPKIDILSESNNMYRTLCSVMATIAILRFYQHVAKRFSILISSKIAILTTIVTIILLFSYRKQTRYIKKRIEVSKEKEVTSA